MKGLKIFTALAIIVIMNSCAPSKVEPLHFKDGVANLAGMWVLSGDNPSELDVILDLALNGDDVNIKAWGKTVTSHRVVRYKDQILISYTTEDGKKFNLLGQIENNNQMRISRTTEAISDFIPLGQLGEKVYRLTRIEENRKLVVKSAVKK